LYEDVDEEPSFVSIEIGEETHDGMLTQLRCKKRKKSSVWRVF